MNHDECVLFGLSVDVRMRYIIAAAGTGIIFVVLSYINQRQGHHELAAILAAAAILFLAFAIGMFVLR